MEEMDTEEGRISTLSLGEYKIPTIEDIPELVTVLLEPSDGPAPYGGKSIGESSNVPVAAAIANAVYDAVGVRILDLPITAEKVFRALRDKRGETGHRFGGPDSGAGSLVLSDSSA
jgi:CO/xanthine dehydrogenase Mo-binding subunit